MSESATVAPYGKWDSPIIAEHLSGDSVHLEGIQVNVSLLIPAINVGSHSS
jgi:hypothetical protein